MVDVGGRVSKEKKTKVEPEKQDYQPTKDIKKC